MLKPINLLVDNDPVSHNTPLQGIDTSYVYTHCALSESYNDQDCTYIIYVISES